MLNNQNYIKNTFLFFLFLKKNITHTHTHTHTQNMSTENMLSTSTHLVSSESAKAPPPCMSNIIDKGKTIKKTTTTEAEEKKAKFPVDAAAVAEVYQWWTEKGRAPWMPENEKPIQILNRRNLRRIHLKQRAQNGIRSSPLSALNMDLALTIGSALPQSIPYFGETILIRAASANTRKVTATTAFRVMVVFWSPTYIAAKRKSVKVKNSSEGQLVQLLEQWFLRFYPNVLLTVAYVVPRWIKKTGSFGHFSNIPKQGSIGVSQSRQEQIDAATYQPVPFSQQDEAGTTTTTTTTTVLKYRTKFMETHPSVMSYGLWQLGLRVVFTKPHLILSTNADVARVISCTNSMDYGVLANPQIRDNIFYNIQPAAREPPLPAKEQEQQQKGPLAALIIQQTTATSQPKTQMDTHTTNREQWNKQCDVGLVRRTVPNLHHPRGQPRVLSWPGNYNKKNKGCVLDQAPFVLYNWRIPHPFLLFKPPENQAEIAAKQEHRGWFQRTMKRVVLFAKQLEKQNSSPKEKAILSLRESNKPDLRAKKKKKKKKKKKNLEGASSLLQERAPEKRHKKKKRKRSSSQKQVKKKSQSSYPPKKRHKPEATQKNKKKKNKKKKKFVVTDYIQEQVNDSGTVFNFL